MKNKTENNLNLFIENLAKIKKDELDDFLELEEINEILNNEAKI